MAKFLEKLEKQHPSWSEFVKSNESELNRIEEDIEKKGYTPCSNLVLRFLQVDLSKVKIIILGQDPYKQEGVATGRAFEVGGLKCWDKPMNQSLLNILKAIYYTYKEKKTSIKDIRKDINSVNFKILPPNELFCNLEEQGVLFLNTSFTCEIGKSGSHEENWKPFTSHLIKYILKANPNCRWLLWGKVAEEFAERNGIPKTYKYPHPRNIVFIEENGFEKTKDLINWTGYKLFMS
jgi:uracil-DNA glycosylase